ncbi:MAG: hypothetical protein CMJ89_12260 [Planctomycetes bacterium]|jgi:hypothetical protein|nr:hypothetical protein [Planctomycetota bacterium]
MSSVTFFTFLGPLLARRPPGGHRLGLLDQVLGSVFITDQLTDEPEQNPPAFHPAVSAGIRSQGEAPY